MSSRIIKTSDHRIIVTGAAGFIGYHVARRLLADGHTVVGVDNLNDYYDPALKQARLDQIAHHSGFTFHRLDLTDRLATSDLFAAAKPSVVIHLAAQAGVRYSLTNPHAYIDTNINGFLNILEGCRATKPNHLIYASSSSVYGANTKVPFHEDDPVISPVSLYAATKRSNELMAHTYAHLYGIPSSGLRFFTVYGPWGRPDMAYFKFVRAAYTSEAVDIYNNGDMRRDFTYIDDIVEGVVRLLDHSPAALARGPVPHALYNIGNNHPERLLDFVSLVEQATGRTLKKRLLPMQDGDVYETYADITRLQAVTGFAPDTPLAVGLKKFVIWFRDFYGEKA